MPKLTSVKKQRMMKLYLKKTALISSFVIILVIRQFPNIKQNHSNKTYNWWFKWWFNDSIV